MSTPIWQIQYGDGPLVAAAIHDGDHIRTELQEWLAISAPDRLREQDPFTGGWTSVAPTRIIGMRSRFEFDLNRPREKAVYLTPEDAWGLTVWRDRLPEELVDRSLAAYDSFYVSVQHLLERLVQKYGHVVVFDVHSYNHMRDGHDGSPADPNENPEVNIGTGTMNREHWAPIVDRFLSDLSSVNYMGRQLDVRENVKFRGGNFARWIHETFPDSVCAIAIEFKKFFMDEWTGQADQTHISAIEQALQATAAGVIRELETFEQAKASE